MMVERFLFLEICCTWRSFRGQHSEVGIKCSSLEIDIVYTFGKEAVYTDSKISKNIFHKHFKSKEILIKALKDTLEKKDKVLFKGSRGMQMDFIIEKVFKV